MPDQTPLRVLLVDDNELVRSLLAVILRSAAFSIVGEAPDAPSAIALASQLQPQIILLDIFMPGMSGLEAIAPLRTAAPSAKILMVSGSDDANSVTEAIQAGASGFIIKPFDSKTVISTLKKMQEQFVLSGPAN